MADKSEAPECWQAQPGPGNPSATAAGNPFVARRKAKRQGAARYTVTPSAGAAFNISVSGRDRWALEQLRQAGAKGCTTLDNPAPRWSSYVHKLRALGVEIATLHERHAGDFPGGHGRYVLRSAVTGRQDEGAAFHNDGKAARRNAVTRQEGGAA